LNYASANPIDDGTFYTIRSTSMFVPNEETTMIRLVDERDGRTTTAIIDNLHISQITPEIQEAQ
jgi:hypothetical protein